MVEKVDRILNKINIKGLKVITFLALIVCFLSANMLIIRGLYDNMHTYFDMNIIVGINVWYFLTYICYYRFQRDKIVSAKIILESIFNLIVFIYFSLPVLFKPSSAIAHFFDISVYYSQIENFVFLLGAGFSIIYFIYLYISRRKEQ